MSTVIFLHGWGGNKNSFAAAVNGLMDNHKCLAVDFPGFGDEPPPKNAFSVEDYVDWLHEKLLRVGVRFPVVLIGHSFGGRVAIVYSRKYAEFVEKLVLVDSAGIKPKLKINKLIKVIWFRFCKKCATISLYSKEKLAKHGSSDWKNLPENMKGTFVKVISQDLSADAKLINVPTLIVWGERDKDTPLYMAKKLHKLINGSKLVVYEGAGHFAYIDRSCEFIDLINNFIG